MKNISLHAPSVLLGLGLATALGWKLPSALGIQSPSTSSAEDTIRAKKIVIVDDEGTTRLVLDGKLGRVWIYDPSGVFPAITLSGENHMVGFSGPRGEVYGYFGKHGLGVHDSKGLPRIGLGVDEDEGAIMWIDSDGDGEGRSLRE